MSPAAQTLRRLRMAISPYEVNNILKKGNYFNVPVLIDEDDVAVLGTEIELLPDKINALWE